MRRHVVTCARCRAYYRRHLVLAALDPTALGPEERLARELDLHRRRRHGNLFTVTLAAIAAVALLGLCSPSPSNELGFTARGSLVVDASARHEEATRVGSAIGIYRVLTNDRGTLRAEGVLHHDDELAFTYATQSASHLMVFGVDDHGGIYWFHPAWTTETDNPTAIVIEADHHPHELSEAIRHRFLGDHLEIHGLFLDHPISVRDVESRVHARSLAVGTQVGPVFIPGGVDTVTKFEVVR